MTSKLPDFLRPRKKLESLDDAVDYLNKLLSDDFEIDESNRVKFLRHILAYLSMGKVEVYSNEHPPPHFHVKGPNIDASFSIDNCELISGEVSSSQRRKIEAWHQESRHLLVDKWNRTRPSNCTVGPIAP